MTADPQEPLGLTTGLLGAVQTGEHDLAVGQRVGRRDPLVTRILANIYWNLYRRLVQPEIPVGGVDVFACRRNVRDQILRLHESNNSLIGLLFWVGFRRATVPYPYRGRARDGRCRRRGHALGATPCGGGREPGPDRAISRE
jgi:hypothetical protein